MKPIRLLFASFLVAAALAGCLGSETGSSSPSTTPPSSPPTAGNGTGNASGPAAAVKILQNGTEVAAVNGSFPLGAGVNVTLDGSGSSDPGGGNLTYAWAFGDNGTAAEPTVVHVYAKPGNYTLTLTVRDAGNRTASLSVNITVVPTGPAPGTLLRTEKKQFKATVTSYDEANCGSTPAGMDKATFTWAITAAEPDGTKTVVSEFTMKITQSTTDVDTDFHFYAPDGKEVGSSHVFEPQNGPEPGFDVKGTFAPGTYQLVIQACAAVQNSVTVDMTAAYVVA